MNGSLLKEACPCTADDGPLSGPANAVDRATGAAIAQLSSGLSPASVGAAFGDWATHLAISPGRQMHLAAKAARKITRLADYARQVATGNGAIAPCIQPLPQDHRFDDPAWQSWPFNLIHQAFLLNQQWWDQACCSVGGVTQRHEDMVRFSVRQMLDMMAPSNFIATNPVIQRRIAETGGQCLSDGFANLFDDMRRTLARERPAGAEAFRPGIEVAATPGEIIYRNHLIELIQYRPATETVHSEPLLIVPAWIMKFYILDLSPENSLVRWLVGQGFTVFMISWRNPGEEDRGISFDDYRRLGVMPALDAVAAITGSPRIHAVGYCLGGTLLAITAAAMARDGDNRFASMTLFAAQTEFSEPGELGLFIDAAQIHFLENLMWTQGYLDSWQMGGAFQMLRSNDLLWSRMIRDYLMGDAEPMNDLMAWNSDGTRLPLAMHSQYLRELFLDDDLAEGRYMVEGRSIALSDIRVPIFAVGTEWDHVAPWRSVFKIHLLTETEVTFLLASGGHNAGIVSEPGHSGQHFQMMTHAGAGGHVDPESWVAQAERHDGSWWPGWGRWLASHAGLCSSPPALGAPDKGFACLDMAPGTYVLEH
ncbi:alpha/beta fold hydrolase [Sphingobium sp. BYY-5]|uniref:PHA/PHB synthase family protein n=1 Tax=Sphingobium sp. BYY-5 TaxID=2926400 RepID=UPI001FA72DEC|nr:alpha/beta fold hydrolase [Sphingobium sp. BYY-5]MCI4592465.1 alpha/beta fold hydrolase [Sphingobium sp. BYY-5]